MRKIKLDDRIKNRFNMIFGLIISKYGLFICILFCTTIYMIPKLLKNNSYENFIYAIVIVIMSYITTLYLYIAMNLFYDYTESSFEKVDAILNYKGSISEEILSVTEISKRIKRFISDRLGIDTCIIKETVEVISTIENCKTGLKVIESQQDAKNVERKTRASIISSFSFLLSVIMLFVGKSILKVDVGNYLTIVILLIVPLVLYFVDKWYTSTRFKKSEAIVIYFLKDIMIKKIDEYEMHNKECIEVNTIKKEEVSI